MNVTIIADASYCAQSKVAGYGFWLACARGKVGGSGTIIEDVGDNNSAEMMAVCNAIWHGLTEKLIERGDKLLVQTDCLAAIDRFEGKRVVSMTNQQERIITYYEKTVQHLELDVQFRHVKGHTVHTGARFVANRMCDKRAKQEMRKARDAKIRNNHINYIKGLLA